MIDILGPAEGDRVPTQREERKETREDVSARVEHSFFNFQTTYTGCRSATGTTIMTSQVLHAAK